jgi:indolepyruvate ferredoxin oxidoreductase beta subunit
VDDGRPTNILIAGVGGQGVNTLARVIAGLSNAAGIHCTAAVFKGGAQRLGSVHAELRLLGGGGDGNGEPRSADIPIGELDLLLGLEPSEALRHQGLIGPRTVLIVNTRREPFFLERTAGFSAPDAVSLIEALGIPVTADDFTARALERFGTRRMVNYLVGLAAVEGGLLPFGTREYARRFARDVGLADGVAETMRSTT